MTLMTSLQHNQGDPNQKALIILDAPLQSTALDQAAFWGMDQ